MKVSIGDWYRKFGIEIKSWLPEMHNPDLFLSHFKGFNLVNHFETRFAIVLPWLPRVKTFH